MRNIKFKVFPLLILLSVGFFACNDQLQVGNPNSPTLTDITTEPGITSLALGGTYITGYSVGDGWLGDSYFSLCYGYSELMGDHLGASAANQLISVVNVPDWVQTGGGTKVTSSSRAIPLLRQYNTRSSTGAGYNPTYYQWLNSYALNNACNVVLANLAKVKFAATNTTNANNKLNTFRAWCYWWKAVAYAQVGTQYYSGIIADDVSTSQPVSSLTNKGNYVLHDQVIARSNVYLLKADSCLALIGSDGDPDYTEVIPNLIPSFFQTGQGHGNPPLVSEWRRNIQTMLAKNILLNKLAPFVNNNLNATITTSSTTAMTNADWNAVLGYATNGIQQGDNCFSGFAAAVNTVWSASGGTVSSLSTGTVQKSTFKISERLMQNFGPSDQRLANFSQVTPYINDNFGTRWRLLRSDKLSQQVTLPSGVYGYASFDTPGYEVFMVSSWEENALMLAEANIRLGKLDAGLALVDKVRTYQGAGVPAVSGTSLSQVQAMQQLVAERQVALLFRGVAFYDARRWGWTYDVSNGGGSYGNTFLVNNSTKNGLVDTNTTINYNFLDYWDVPADESVLNPQGASSAAVVNPNFQ